MSTPKTCMKHLVFRSRLFTSLALGVGMLPMAACGSGGAGGAGNEGGPTLTPGGPFGSETCVVVGQPTAADSDGDGLSDEQERTGWTVAADLNGDDDTDDPGESYHVTSNPALADADGDCLGDKEEFIARIDPMSADTDLDFLTDYDELKVYFSLPANVDSDGDSHGNPKLWDHDEAKIHETSPTLPDTDGDGLDDWREIIDLAGQFNPLLADVPNLRVEFATEPGVIVRSVEGSGTSESFGTERSTEAAETTSTSTTNSRSTSTTIEETHTAGIEVESTVALPPSASVKASYEYSYSEATTTESGYSYTAERAREARKGFAESSTATNEMTNENYAGELSLVARIVNDGNLAFTLAGLSLNAYERSSDRPLDPGLIGALNPSVPFSTFPDRTIAPGDSIEMVFENTDLDVTVARGLLENPGSIFLNVGSYEVENAEGVSFTHNNTDIEAKTAKIVIDFGPSADPGAQGLPPERYMVAANVTKDPETGMPRGITVQKALRDIIDLPFETAERDVEDADGNVVRRRVLSSVRGVAASKEKRSLWLVSTSSDNGLSSDFEDIVLKPGDLLHLVFMQDADSDGIFAREEFLYGTRDNRLDSDDDGIYDWKEAESGWQVHVEYPQGHAKHGTSYETATYANNADSDFDGLLDGDELAAGTDAQRADTDGDGFNDSVDTAPLDPRLPGRLALGSSSTCAMSGGELGCVGGTLGEADVPLLGDVRAFTSGRNTNCAIDDTGLHCWGYNAHGEATVPSNYNPTLVALGPYNGCLNDDFGVRCWGWPGTLLDVPAGVHATDLAVADDFACAVTTSGVVCWGDWGVEAQQAAASPTGATPIQLVAGFYQMCLLDADGVRCFAPSDGKGAAVVPTGIVNPWQIAAGESHSCALAESGVHCWGDDSSGQSTVPTNLQNPVAIAAGGNRTCAIDDTGLVCWGQ